MSMGNKHGTENKREWVNMNRVSRQEQYDWFKTIRDADEDDIIQIIKSSPQMITTVMYFDTFFIADKTCTCEYDLEQCVLPGDNRKEIVLKRLENSIAMGVCPHVLLQQIADNTDVFNASDDVLANVYKHNDIDMIVDTPSNGLGCGFYWIHLAIIFGKTKVIMEVLPTLKKYAFPSFVWYTIQNWFSPLYFAALSEDKELCEFLWKLHPRFFQDKLRMKVMEGNSFRTTAITMIERIASLDKVEALKALINILGIRNKTLMQSTMNSAFSTRAFSCIMLLMERGVKLDSVHLNNELMSVVYRDDVEMMVALLKFHNVRISPSLLKTTVKKGNIEMVEAVLQCVPNLRKSSKDYGEFSASLTEAVLMNSTSIVEMLIKKSFDVNTCFRNLSVLKWASIFKFDDLERLLTDNGARNFYKNDSVKMCVFNSVLNIQQRNDHLIRRLLQIGEDVNDTSDGTPPFYTSMRLRRYDIMYALLLSGADPYLQKETWKYFLIRQTADNWRLLVRVFVRANVILSCDVRTTMLDYIFSETMFFRNSDMARLIILSAHTLTDHDKKNLKDNKNAWNCPVFLSDVDDYLYKPKSLSILCRNSIRKQSGQNLHKFLKIKKEEIPTRFVDFLQCEDVLEQFYTPHDRQKFSTEFGRDLLHQD